jgi:hypothetical protein
MTAYQDRVPVAATGSSANRIAPAPKPKSADLGGQQIKNAVAYNNAHWRDPHRSEVLAKLRAAPGESRFLESDVVAIAALQKREGAVVDGRLSGPTMAALLRGGLHLSEVQAKPGEVRLLFYPGEFEDLAAWKKARADAIAANGGKALGTAEFDAVRQRSPPGHGTIYVELRGNIVQAIKARGGPPFTLQDGFGHTGDPSKAGTYRLGEGKAVTTSVWDDSEIAWGAPLRRVDGQVQFKNPGQDWQFATGPQAKLKQRYYPRDFEEGYGTPLKEWRKNAFGKTAFRVEGSPGLFIHTGPREETALRQEEEAHQVHTPLELTHSHGCLHVDPFDRDEMMKTGYLQKGVTLVIKRYDESLDPTARNKRRP